MSTAEYAKDDAGSGTSPLTEIADVEKTVDKNNEQGQCFIPASQRPDGSWRKARRVKDGYVPQEEMPLYESKGKQWAKGKSDFPVGLAPDDVAAAKIRQQANDSGIPGLAVTPKPETSKSQKKKSGGSKKKAANIKTNITKQLEDTHISNSVTDKDQHATTDPVKRLRNLRKKLRDIEKLEKQINSGELKKPEEDQLLKVKKKGEVLQLVKELEKEVDESN